MQSILLLLSCFYRSSCQCMWKNAYYVIGLCAQDPRLRQAPSRYVLRTYDVPARWWTDARAKENRLTDFDDARRDIIRHASSHAKGERSTEAFDSLEASLV
eukprot:scaffold145_cov54-Attheya_sp.AAC.4